MKPTDQLKQEHRAIKLMLDIMEKVCQKIDSGEKANTGHLDSIIEFLKVFADKCHHGKEEDLLFPAMVEAGIPGEGGPIGVMLQEHVMGRGFIGGMSESLARYKEGESDAASVFSENAKNYISLLRPHIDKEDNILYMIADAHLSDQKQEELIVAFNSVEEEKIGKGKHEEFHRLLDDLKKEYIEQRMSVRYHNMNS